MSHSDELNVELARLYAWKLGTSNAPLQIEDHTVTAPKSAAPAPESALPVLDDESPSAEQLALQRSAARAAAAELAETIERLYARPPAEAAASTLAELERLLMTIGEAGLSMVALGRYPRAFLRLARLCNRHWEALPEATREQTASAFFWMPFDHPEATELLVELAEAGNWALSQRLALRLAVNDPEPDGERLPGFQGLLSRRLLELLRRADSLPHPNVTRLLVVDWLGLDLSAESIPALLKLIRMPHLGIRSRALDLLLEGFRPSPLRADDVLFLLKDLFVRLPVLKDNRNYEVALRYADVLQRAVIKVRPEGGAALLEEVIRCGLERDLRYTECNEQWALYTLSAAYPEHALPFIDAGLLNSSADFRLIAVHALGQLPKELARPRLLVAAADGAPKVAERARALWLERYDGVCPVGPFAGFPLERLPGPPSPHFESRLAVLRSPSEEARHAMIEALFDEAPDVEALYLITFALSDDTLLASNRRRLPKDARHIVLRLYRRFGAPAIAALCWLAERYPRAAFTSWCFEMTQHVQKRSLHKRDLGPLRDLAVRWLDDAHALTCDSAFRTLAVTGVSPEHRDALRDRLLQKLAGPPRESLSASNVFLVWGRDPALDRQLTETAQAAHVARNGPLFVAVAQVGFARRIPALTELAEQLVADWLRKHDASPGASPGALSADSEKPNDDEHDSEKPKRLSAREWPTLRIANQCCAHLSERGRLQRGWVLSSLRNPKNVAFVLAAYLQGRDLSRAARAALLAALDPATVGQKPAEVAAMTLLRISAIEATDPRIATIAAHADRSFRRYVLFEAAFRSSARRELSPIVLDYLRTATLAELEEVERVFRIGVLGVHYQRPELLSKLELIRDEPLRKALLGRFPDEPRAAPGWLDDGEELVL